MQSSKLILLLAGAALLVGCPEDGGNPQPTNSPAIIVTPSPTFIQDPTPTFTSSPTASLSPTATQPPDVTVTPTATQPPEVTLTPTPSQPPLVTDPPTPTATATATASPTPQTDADGDGYFADVDCDDNDASLNPDTVWYLDHDKDGYGDGAVTLTQCEQPADYIQDGTDCDDLDAAYHPGATEDNCADPNDYNCDGQTGYADSDGDGFAACAECDDTNAAVNPDADEICDGLDNDCDEAVDLADDDVEGTITVYDDTDGDLFGDPTTGQVACEAGAGTVTDNTDCDDSAAGINPDAAEVCTDEGAAPTDEDCDGAIDDADPNVTGAPTWYIDYDQDEYGVDTITATQCVAPPYHVATVGDCDDTDAAVNPAATEACNYYDDDCDDAIDEDTDKIANYPDDDGDGFGRGEESFGACEVTEGYADVTGDCDDENDDIYPDAPETCNQTDDDCDDAIDEDSPDRLTIYLDSDGDGYGEDGLSLLVCEVPDGYSLDNTDCDDEVATTHPGADEACNEIDDDCDTEVDEGLTGEVASCPVRDCLELQQLKPDAPTGTYWIDPGQTGQVFEAFCDMETDGGGWTLMYKLTEGIPVDPSGLWFGGALNDDDPSLLGFGVATDQYVNAIPAEMFNTGGYTSDEVRLGLYEGGAEVAYVHLYSAFENNNDWFDLRNLMSSSWPDMSTEPRENDYFFDITGHASINRDFLIYRNYGGCAADNGWLVVNTSPDDCSWETNNPNVGLLYSTQEGYQNYQSGTNDGTLGLAEVMTLMTRRQEICGDSVDNDTDGIIDEGVLGGSAFCPAPNCDYLLGEDAAIEDGIYWLDVDGPGGETPFRTRCDFEGDEAWMMVYKVSDGVAGSAWDVWRSGAWGEGDVGLLEPGKARAHFASRVIGTYWNNGLIVAQVKVRMEGPDDGIELVFDGLGSDNTSWMSRANLMLSPWTDLQTEGQNYFGVAGDTANNRSFFINRNYSGCSVDAGWMVAAGRDSGCSWESAEPAITLMYAAGETLVNWESAVNAGSVGRADTLTVWINATEAR